MSSIRVVHLLVLFAIAAAAIAVTVPQSLSVVQKQGQAPAPSTAKESSAGKVPGEHHKCAKKKDKAYQEALKKCAENVRALERHVHRVTGAHGAIRKYDNDIGLLL